MSLDFGRDEPAFPSLLRDVRDFRGLGEIELRGCLADCRARSQGGFRRFLDQRDIVDDPFGSLGLKGECHYGGHEQEPGRGEAMTEIGIAPVPGRACNEKVYFLYRDNLLRLLGLCQLANGRRPSLVGECEKECILNTESRSVRVAGWA